MKILNLIQPTCNELYGIKSVKRNNWSLKKIVYFELILVYDYFRIHVRPFLNHSREKKEMLGSLARGFGRGGHAGGGGMRENVYGRHQNAFRRTTRRTYRCQSHRNKNRLRSLGPIENHNVQRCGRLNFECFDFQLMMRIPRYVPRSITAKFSC